MVVGKGLNKSTEAFMKNKDFLNEVEPCCELCEHSFKSEFNKELYCRYKNSMKKKDCSDVCKNFSFDIFAYKPKTAKLPKAFDFTKI